MKRTVAMLMIICLIFGCNTHNENNDEMNESNAQIQTQTSLPLKEKTLSQMIEYSNSALKTTSLHQVMGWDKTDKTIREWQITHWKKQIRFQSEDFLYVPDIENLSPCS